MSYNEDLIYSIYPALAKPKLEKEKTKLPQVNIENFYSLLLAFVPIPLRVYND